MTRSLSILTLLALSACATDASVQQVDTLTDSHNLSSETSVEVEAGVAALAPLAAELDVELVPVRHTLDRTGIQHTRVQQTVDGVPVFGAEAIVHLRLDGSLRGVTDRLIDDISVNTTPDYSADEALDFALAETGLEALDLAQAPVAELVILPMDEGDRLTWKFRLMHLSEDAHDDRIPVVFVDAHDGSVVWQYDDLQTDSGTGSSTYYGTVDLDVYQGGSTWYLEDTGRDIGAFTANNGFSTFWSDMVTDGDSHFNGNDAAVDAHYGMMAAYDFYEDVLGWQGINGSGGPDYGSSATGSGSVTTAIVNYGSNWSNASWNGSYMKFGDGNGTTKGPYTELDTVGHEWTHGVVDYTANLVYQDESGAMNESYADIMGEMIERDVVGDANITWIHGEEKYLLYGSSNGRFMCDPAQGGKPDHYDDRYTGTGDNGGVHTNSSLGNLAFCLLSQGGDNPTYGGWDAKAIGADDATQIAFHALDNYLVSYSDFADTRDAWLDSAEDLYGEYSEQYMSTMDAWSLIGVGEASCGGAYEKKDSMSFTSGDQKYLGDSGGFLTSESTLKAQVRAPAGSNLELRLQKATSSGWTTIASDSGTGTLQVAKEKPSKWTPYRWKVKVNSGSGDFIGCWET